MGLGRREFLKLMGTTAAFIIASPILNSIIINDDLYFNRKLGVAFKKPSGWHFNNVLDMGEVAKGQILDLKDEKLAQELLDDTPLVSMSKVPLTYPGRDFTPSINVYLNIKNSGDTNIEESDFVKKLYSNTKEPLRTIKKDILATHYLLKKCRVLSEEVCFTVSKYPAVQYISSFLFEHKELSNPMPVRMHTLLVVQNKFWYWFRVYDAPSRGKNFTMDYSPFIESILMV